MWCNLSKDKNNWRRSCQWCWDCRDAAWLLIADVLQSMPFLIHLSGPSYPSPFPYHLLISDGFFQHQPKLTNTEVVVFLQHKESFNSNLLTTQKCFPRTNSRFLSVNSNSFPPMISTDNEQWTSFTAHWHTWGWWVKTIRWFTGRVIVAGFEVFFGFNQRHICSFFHGFFRHILTGHVQNNSCLHVGGVGLLYFGHIFDIEVCWDEWGWVEFF